MLQDVYGNTYTYGHLGDVAETYPAPKDRSARRQAAAPSHESSQAREATLRRETAGAHDRAETTAERRRCRPRSACSRTRTARPPGRRRRRAARRPTTDELTQAAPLGFKPRDFSPSRSRRAPASSAARSSATSARAPRPTRRTCASRSAPPAPAPRGSTRSRSSTAGSSSSRPRSTAPRARTRSSARTPRTRRSASCCC